MYATEACPLLSTSETIYGFCLNAPTNDIFKTGSSEEVDKLHMRAHKAEAPGNFVWSNRAKPLVKMSGQE